MGTIDDDFVATSANWHFRVMEKWTQTTHTQPHEHEQTASNGLLVDGRVVALGILAPGAGIHHLLPTQQHHATKSWTGAADSFLLHPKDIYYVSVVCVRAAIFFICKTFRW